MSPYSWTVFALLAAFLLQSAVAATALEIALRHARPQPWIALSIGAGFLALHHGHTLMLAVRTGLYDAEPAALAFLAALLFLLGVLGLRHEIKRLSLRK